MLNQEEVNGKRGKIRWLHGIAFDNFRYYGRILDDSFSDFGHSRSQPLPLFWETRKSVAGKLSWKKNIIGNLYVYSAII